MRPTWCRLPFAVALLALTATGASSAPTSVTIEQSVPGSSGPARPAVVLVRDLPVPSSGSVVQIDASARGLEAPARLATVTILGGGASDATIVRSFRSIVAAPSAVVGAIVRDPHATVTFTVIPRVHPEAARTAGPYPIAVTSR